MNQSRERSNHREQFRSAVYSDNPQALASVLIQVTNVAPTKSLPEPQPPRDDASSSSSLEDNFGNEWGSVLKFWLDTMEFALAGYAVRAYETQAQLHAAFNQLFGSSPGNWLVPSLHAVCKSTHRLAKAADKEVGKADHAKLQSAVTLLQESFSRTFNDRKEYNNPDAPLNGVDGSKKAGVLAVVNELFVIYFFLNTLRLCKNLVRPVEARKLHDSGSMSELVTYKYYTGRLALFEDQYAEAEQNLEFAFNNCYKEALRNKRVILRYLIPVKLYRGRLPSTALLEKYGLTEYAPLSDSMRKGDLRTFTDTLERFQDVSIRQGTYLLLEKCKTVCYRNLFKRIHYATGKTQIPLSMVVNGVFRGVLDMTAMDLDQVECILANLIYRGFVRGYLSHTKRVLVLSKRDPFPVTTVIAK
ncbi:hypothetical protein ACA910_013531 [Epithemia clementina (nom. ined.)]